MYNAEAIIVRVRDFQEADKIAVLLTREEGKLQAVAKGARRPRNRYAAAFQLFTHLKGSFFHGRNMDTVSQLDIIDSFRHLRADLDRMAYATYVCELIDELVKEKQPNESIYLLLLTSLHLLNAPELAPEPVLRAFELKLLAILGLRPSLTECVVCGNAVGAEAGPVLRFAPSLGGLLCPTCPSQGAAVQRLTRGTVESLKRLLEGDIRRAHVVRLEGELGREVDRVLTAYILEQTDRPLKSKQFLDLLRG